MMVQISTKAKKACSSDAKRITPTKKERREIDAPDHEAGEQQSDQAHDDGEEHELLPGVVTPHLGQVFLPILISSLILLSQSQSRSCR